MTRPLSAPSAASADLRLTGADSAPGATRRDLGARVASSGDHAPEDRTCALLEELADLHLRVSRVLLELSRERQNRLAAGATSSVMDAMQATNEAAPQTDPLMRVKDLAERLRVDEKTVRRMRERGDLPPAIELGSVIRWRASTIETWIAEREEAGE